MSARNQHTPGRTAPSDLGSLRRSIDALLVEASAFVAAARIKDAAIGLLPRKPPGDAGSDEAMRMMADALDMAMDLVLFAPSAAGHTAFDRLARQRRTPGITEPGLDTIRQASFRLLRVEAIGAGTASLRDLVSDEALEVADTTIEADLVGLPLVGRLGPVGGGQHVFVGRITPLHEDGVAAVLSSVRPGARALPQRCAETTYRHVLSNGGPDIWGLGHHVEHDTVDGDDTSTLSELDQIARRWAERPGPRDPNDMQRVRQECGLEDIVDMLASAVLPSLRRIPSLPAAYAEIVGVQIETMLRRDAAGSVTYGLDALTAEVARRALIGSIPPGARELLADVRQRLGAARAADGAGRDADLDRLIGRIQGLRAKTVDQGCTEAEALAAAGKVAELLDRYGLSLSELDLQRQACEGAAVETGRKRVGPVDQCVLTVATFFDCRVWGEKGAGGMLRHVFFGLPADVAAARYLYELVERAFETETTAFRAGATYAAMPSTLRRTATNSFGLGLARGIVAKLESLRAAREGALRGSGGRDLVVAKAGLVDAELAQLGLNLRQRTATGGRRVLEGAFLEGREAGLGFEYQPGLGQG